jgi:hyperosmotically inducible protein
MERFDPAEGTQSGPVRNVDDNRNAPSDPDQTTDLDNTTERPLGDANLLPLGETPLAGAGILPIAGTLGASTAGGIGVSQGTTGALLPGAALYPVIAPLTEYNEADQGVADRVETALAEDGRLNAQELRHLKVDVVNGTVVLSGHLPSEAECQIAGRIAAEVTGVRHVDNRVTAGG